MAHMESNCRAEFQLNSRPERTDYDGELDDFDEQRTRLFIICEHIHLHYKLMMFLFLRALEVGDRCEGQLDWLPYYVVDEI